MKLLIIGQTPPPFGGQSINIEKMIHILKEFDFDYKFIRMDFSDEMSENGTVSFKKIFRLVKIFFRICFQLLVYRPDYTYYPPCGPEKVPMLRDIILLFPIRLFRYKVIYHFHAGGLSEGHSMLSPVLKKFYEFAYAKPDHAICMSPFGSRDPLFLQAKQITYIPYGITANTIETVKKISDDIITVLFVGVCRETKGILDFIEIIRMARLSGHNIVGKIVGNIFSEKEKNAIDAAVSEKIVTYEGIKTGEEKNKMYRSAHMFLFPTFFEHESFPTVNLEAYSFGLPVISTKWRGVNDQVKHGVTGFIHDVHDVRGMADSIIKMVRDEKLYTEISRNAFREYIMHYRSEEIQNKILDFYTTLFNSVNPAETNRQEALA